MQKVTEYEKHAAKCRQMAAETTNPQLKKQLEDAADVWDRLANERRQGIVETNPVS
jgi:TATA-binding protein-associated factor Taf7